MCTVTYTPYKKHGFILTSSRDEKLERLARARLIEKKRGNSMMVYPEEPVSKGTWFGCTSNGIAGCLLNGAFEKYERKPSYRKSRGLIFIEILDSLGSKKTLTQEFLQEIEPFTLVLVKYFQNDRYVQEFRWDGKEIYNRTIDSEAPHLWASAALFEPGVIEEKKVNYMHLLNTEKEIDSEKLFEMHRNKKLTGQPYYPEFNNLKGGLVNMSQVIGDGDLFEMIHLDVQSDELVNKTLKLEKASA